MMEALLIAPYSGLLKTAENLRVPDDVKLDMEVANLQKGVEAAQLAESKGYDIIISRGGTARLIQEAVSIPVVHIDINGYDMLRIFTLIRDIKTSVALVGFESVTRGAATLCNILDYNVNVVTINSGDEVSDHLIRLRSQGYNMVIGDTITVEVAERLGMRGVLITSGQEALMDALEEGKRTCRIFKRIQHQFQTLQETYRSIPVPVILLNGSNEIVDRNPAFLQDIADTGLLNEKKIKEAIQQVGNDGIIRWTECSYFENRYIVQIFLANDAEKIIGLIVHPLEREKQRGSIHMENDWSHVPIVGESNYAIRLRDNLPKLAQGNKAVSIIGERGTGKQTIAREIHLKKYHASAPLITVECSDVSSREVKDWGTQLLRINEGSLVLRNVEQLPVTVQDELLKLLPQTQLQIFALSCTSLDNLSKQQQFRKVLYDKITQYTIHTVPLRHRREDIPELVNYFLTEFHTKNGNETLGVNTDAMEFLLDGKWKGNIKELKKVIQELSIFSPGYYIELSHVQDIMTDIEQDDEYHSCVPLSGTLKELEQEIIHKVMKEEGNNQSQAARRLGINRSTLWRKLNE